MAASSKETQYDVFILFLDNDEAACSNFATQHLLEPLEAEPYGLRCAIEYRDFALGGLWIKEVGNIASNSMYTVILFCSSAECLCAKNNLRAAALSLCDHEKVFFIKCDNCQVPAELESTCIIDASKQCKHKYLLQRIYKAVKGTVTDKPPEPGTKERFSDEDMEVFIGLDFSHDTDPNCGIKIHNNFRMKVPVLLEECIQLVSYQMSSMSENGRIHQAIQSVLQIYIPDAEKSEKYLQLLQFADCRSKDVRLKAHQAICCMLTRYLSKCDIVQCSDEYFYIFILDIESRIACLLQKDTLETLEKLWEAYSIIVTILKVSFAINRKAKHWVLDGLGRKCSRTGSEAFDMRFSWILEYPYLHVAKHPVSVRSTVRFCQQCLQHVRDNKMSNEDTEALVKHILAPIDNKNIFIRKFSKLPVIFRCILEMLMCSKIIHDKDLNEKMYKMFYDIASNMRKAKREDKDKEMHVMCIANCIISVLDNHEYKPASDCDIIKLLFEHIYKNGSDAVKNAIIEKTRNFQFNAYAEIKEKFSTFFGDLKVGQPFVNEAKNFIEGKYGAVVKFRWSTYGQHELQKHTKEITCRGKMGETNIVVKILHPDTYLKTFRNSYQQKDGNISHLHVNELKFLTMLTPSKHVIELLGYQVHQMPLFYIVEDMQTTYKSLKHYILEQRKVEVHLDYDYLQKITVKVVDAVNFCHRNNIVVRNITPSSFLYIKSNDIDYVKLSDFTIAREMKIGKFDQLVFEDKEDLDAQNYLPVLYASPESLLHGIYTVAHDSWSVICTAYEILSMGCPPLHNLTIEKRRPIVEILQLVIYGLKPIYEDFNVPSDVWKVMLNCLEVEYSVRGTLEEFAAALKPSGKHRLSGFCQVIEMPKLLPLSYIHHPEIDGSLGIKTSPGLKTEEEALSSEPPYVNARSEAMTISGYFPCDMAERLPSNPPRITVRHKNRENEFRIMFEEAPIDFFSKNEIDELMQLQCYYFVQMVRILPKPELETFQMYYQINCYGELSLYDIVYNKTKDKHWCQDRLAEVASGCSYLHERGWILRDIRPEFIQIVNGHAIIARISRMTKLKQGCHDSTYSSCKARLDVPTDLKRRIPLETLQEGIFSQGSDVFTFGILVYEVYFLLSTEVKGKQKEELVPYCSLKIDEIPSFLEERNTLEQPCLMPDVIYHVCKKTWYQERLYRPSMADIAESLKTSETTNSYKKHRVSFNGRSVPGVGNMFYHRGSRKHQENKATKMGHKRLVAKTEMEAISESDSQSEFYLAPSSLASDSSTQNCITAVEKSIDRDVSAESHNHRLQEQLSNEREIDTTHNDSYSDKPILCFKTYPQSSPKSLLENREDSSTSLPRMPTENNSDTRNGLYSWGGSSGYEPSASSNNSSLKDVNRHTIHADEKDCYKFITLKGETVQSQQSHMHNFDETTSYQSWGSDFTENSKNEKPSKIKKFLSKISNGKHKGGQKKKISQTKQTDLVSPRLSCAEYEESDFFRESAPIYTYVKSGSTNVGSTQTSRKQLNGEKHENTGTNMHQSSMEKEETSVKQFLSVDELHQNLYDMACNFEDYHSSPDLTVANNTQTLPKELYTYAFQTVPTCFCQDEGYEVARQTNDETMYSESTYEQPIASGKELLGDGEENIYEELCEEF